MKAKLDSVPEEPGVYIFKDKEGKVIYVGKAKSLKKRLQNHFNATDPNEKSYKIVKSAQDFEYIVVKNEREALLLEAELIKKYLPKFNVLLKDDKSYPYLVITEEEFPTVKIARKKDGIKGKPFGPFIPPKTARNIKELIHKIFKLRKCKELSKRSKPCLQYYIDRCTAPCCGYVSKRDYQLQVKGALSFLSGNVKEHINDLYHQIEQLAENLEFERAAILRDQLLSLKNIYESRISFFEKEKNCDVFYLEQKGAVFIGTKLTVRNGIVYGKETFTFDPIDPWDESIVGELFEFKTEKLNIDTVGSIWLKNTYQDKPQVKIFANFNSLIAEFKTEPIPKKIEKVLIKNKSRELKLSLNLEELKKEYEKVFLDSFPIRVEVFDISTLQGTATVGSCVVWENGNFKKEDYRRYKVKTVKGIDDYASMEEVLSRRFKRIKKGEIKTPDLVLIDGGVGQLNVAIKVRDSLSLNFRIFSIAKKEEIVYTDDGEIVETKNYPLIFRFFTSLRDEAHRFAVSFNRKLREKAMTQSVFDGIKGLGTKRKKLLEKFYPDPKEIANTTVEELTKIGIPKTVAQKVIERAKELFLL